MQSEFNLIAKYFTRPTPQADLGVGDDAALLRIAEGNQLVISSDMSVAGTHFFVHAAPYDIGWKSLAVNVSDMAAMGATPKWATLAIALPEIDESWLAEFSRGFFACADAFRVDLIGGDTTRGPLNISVTILGEVPTSRALKRNIWVSGVLGSAALGLAHLQKKVQLSNALTICLKALNTPTPRVALGLALKDIATSCIDISDGLLADLGHILKASKLSAQIDIEKIPCIDYLKNKLQNPQFQALLLAGGDDYELCFTAPSSKREEINTLSKNLNLPITCIAKTTMTDSLNKSGLQACYKNTVIPILKQGFDHFG
jgi:thiamine-monophosphate kinase